MSKSSEISHVSDTALWVAALRGREGERADSGFHDPLATMLAGIRGRKIAGAMPRSALVAWSMAVRTTAIDLLINDALIVALMQHHSLTKLASHDADFDRVTGVTRYGPA